MPRMGRAMLPNYPHHVVQRGHNRQVVFAGARDYLRYLHALTEFKVEFCIKVYAYCLMTNHVHLLLGLGEEVSGLGRLMKRVAGRQTRYHNALEGGRIVVGGPLRIESGGQRCVSLGLRPLHRVESGACTNGGGVGTVPLVECAAPPED